MHEEGDVPYYPDEDYHPQDNHQPQQEQYSEKKAQLKEPPHAMRAEQSVLGALMLDNNTWDKIADKVTADDFYYEQHKLIFKCITRLAEKDIPFDSVTMSEELRRFDQLESVGGMAYVVSISKDTPYAININAYAKTVRENSVRRQLINIGTKIADSGFNPEGRQSEELLDHAEQAIFKIAEQSSKQKTGFVSVTDLAAVAVARIDQLFISKDAMTGVSTGFDEFDLMTTGLQPSDLIIIAGRPSMGKTTFALNIAEAVAIKSHLPVAVFSMEMPGDSLVMRMMSSLGRIDQTRVRTGRLTEDDWSRLTSAVAMITQAKLFIDDTAALSPTELRARARRLTREQGQLGLIVIDYLQLMQIHGSNENRTNEISTISRSLKALAKELNVPVIALSQLNRSLEQRQNKRPIMSDLRESGAIEQDADLITFIYRDEVYNEHSEDKGIAEIIIGKQRNGPIGSTKLHFFGKFTKFENMKKNENKEDSEYE